MWCHTVWFSYEFQFVSVFKGRFQSQYIGCYKDGEIGLEAMGVADAYNTTAMTLELCREKCLQTTETYFGLQVGDLLCDHCSNCLLVLQLQA